MALSLLLVLVLMVSVFAVSAHAAVEGETDPVTLFSESFSANYSGGGNWARHGNTAEIVTTDDANSYVKMAAVVDGKQTGSSSQHQFTPTKAANFADYDYMVFDIDFMTESTYMDGCGFYFHTTDGSSSGDNTANANTKFWFKNDVEGFRFTPSDTNATAGYMGYEANVWHHLTVVVEPDTDAKKLAFTVFVDGVKQYDSFVVSYDTGVKFASIRMWFQSNSGTLAGQTYCYDNVNFRGVKTSDASFNGTLASVLEGGKNIGTPVGTNASNWASWGYDYSCSDVESVAFTATVDGVEKNYYVPEFDLPKVLNGKSTNVVVNLQKDVKLNRNPGSGKPLLSVQSGDKTINLNGYSLTQASAEGHMFQVGSATNLIINGGLNTENQKGKIVRATTKNQMFLHQNSNSLLNFNGVKFEAGGNMLNSKGAETTFDNCEIKFTTSSGKLAPKEGAVLNLINTTIDTNSTGSAIDNSGGNITVNVNGGVIYAHVTGTNNAGSIFEVLTGDVVNITGGAVIKLAGGMKLLNDASDATVVTVAAGVKFQGEIDSVLAAQGIKLPKNNYIKKTAENEYVVGTPDFKVYNNLTLYTDFDLNVYVPADAVKNAPVISGATLVGEYEDEKIGNCYKYVLAGVAPYEAANSVEFTISGYDKDDMAFNLVVSSNVIKYATNILNNADEADAYDLMKSIINYVYASYTMNGKSDETVAVAYDTYCKDYTLSVSESSAANERKLRDFICRDIP